MEQNEDDNKVRSENFMAGLIRRNTLIIYSLTHFLFAFNDLFQFLNSLNGCANRFKININNC